MADRKITQLTETNSPGDNDVLPIVSTVGEGTITYKVTLENLSKASKYSNYNIINFSNSIPVNAPSLDSSYNIAIQKDPNTDPERIALATIYPKPKGTSTINLEFTEASREIQAELKNNSLQSVHFTTGCVEGSAIAVGTITQDNIDPDAKLAGAVGGGTDRVFYENDQTVTTAYTITSGKNAMTAGPIAISDGITVTVPSGSTWTVV